MLFNTSDGNIHEINRCDYTKDSTYYSLIETMFKVYIKPSNTKPKQVRMNNLDALSKVINNHITNVTGK